MELTEREIFMLRFLYIKQQYCCIDDGNLLYHYTTRYDDWTDEGMTNYEYTVESLVDKQLIEWEEPPLDCFIHITEKGIKECQP